MGDDRERTAGPADWFSGMAAAVLEQSLPLVQRWIRSRFGSQASVASLEVDAGRIRLRDLRIPLGTSVVLTVESGLLSPDPSALMNGEIPGQIERLEGQLEGGRANAPRWRAPFVALGRAGGNSGAAVLDVTFGDVAWRSHRTPLRGRATLVLNPAGWRLDGAHFEGPGERLEGRITVGRMPASSELSITAEACLVTRWLEVWEDFGGPALSSWFPPAARVSGGWTLTERSVELGAEIEHGETDLQLSLEATRLGLIRECSLTGTVAWEDLLHRWRASSLAAGEPARLRARLHGAFDKLRGSVVLQSHRLETPLLAAPVAVGLAVGLSDEDARCSLDLGPAGSAELSASVGSEGELTGGGTVLLEPSFFRLKEWSLEAPRTELMLEVSGSRSSPYLVLIASDASCELRRGEATVLSIERGRGRAVLAASPMVQARARVGGGEMRVEYAGGEWRVHAERVKADALRALTLMAPGGASHVAWPETTAVWAGLRGAGARWRGQLHLESETSRLSFDPLVLGEPGEATRFRGSFDLAEVSVALAPLPLGLRGRLSVEGRADGFPRSLSVEGRVLADRLEVEIDGREPVSLEALRALASLDSDGVVLATAEAELFGGRCRVDDLRIGRDGRWSSGELRLEGIGHGLGRWSTGQEVLDDLKIDARVRRSGADRTDGECHLRTHASRLDGRLRYEGGVLDGSVLEGTVAFDDLALWWPLADGAAKVRMELTGAPRTVQGRLSAACEEARLRWSDIVVPLDRARLAARFAPGRIVLEPLTMELLGGSLRLRGVWSSRALEGLVAELSARGLQVGAIALAGGPLSELVDGLLTAELRAVGGNELDLRGALRLGEPRYGALRRMRPWLGRLGLAALDVKGDRPASFEVELSGRRLAVETLVASVPGLTLSGSAQASGAAASGVIELDLNEAWLRRSPWWRLPAQLFGGLRLPIIIARETGGWRARPDFLAALRGVLEGSKPGLGSAGREPTPDPLAHLEDDAVIERAAAGGSEGGDAIDALLRRGMSPEEIVDRVSRRCP